MRVIKKIALIVIVLVLIMTVGIYTAPGFLLYTTPCEKADAIVLLLGPDFSARHHHAQDLLQKGLSDYLIIPAYNKIYIVEEGVIKNLRNKTGAGNGFKKNNSFAPHYFEDTHLELLDAKKTMDQYGKKTAIFVSSPYHMRRIQVIVTRVFGSNGTYYFSPTPYEEASQNLWHLKPSDWKKVWREYLKISWFMLYSLWT